MDKCKKKVVGFLCASGDEKGWRDIPEGGIIIDAGNSRDYFTGSWRIFRPLVDKKRCINCLQCWISCPDISIFAEDGKMAGYDYDYCKGCGICSQVCPVKCIKMVEEDKFLETNKYNDFDERGRTSTVEIKGDIK